MRFQSEGEKVQMQERINKLETTLAGLRTSTAKELEIKDIIISRNNDYIALLRKELAYAKLIIKSPLLREKAHKAYNFKYVKQDSPSKKKES